MVIKSGAYEISNGIHRVIGVVKFPKEGVNKYGVYVHESNYAKEEDNFMQNYGVFDTEKEAMSIFNRHAIGRVLQ